MVHHSVVSCTSFMIFLQPRECTSKGLLFPRHEADQTLGTPQMPGFAERFRQINRDSTADFAPSGNLPVLRLWCGVGISFEKYVIYMMVSAINGRRLATCFEAGKSRKRGSRPTQALVSARGKGNALGNISCRLWHSGRRWLC